MHYGIDDHEAKNLPIVFGRALRHGVELGIPHYAATAAGPLKQTQSQRRKRSEELKKKNIDEQLLCHKPITSTGNASQ